MLPHAQAQAARADLESRGHRVDVVVELGGDRGDLDRGRGSWPCGRDRCGRSARRGVCATRRAPRRCARGGSRGCAASRPAPVVVERLDRLARVVGRGFDAEVVERRHLAGTRDRDEAVGDGAQLPDVARPRRASTARRRPRPGSARARSSSRRLEVGRGLAESKKVREQLGDVAAAGAASGGSSIAAAQRGGSTAARGQRAALHGGGEVGVGRGDDRDVDAARLTRRRAGPRP